MRIVITQLGDEILKKLTEEEKSRKTKLDDEARFKKLTELKAIAQANESKMNVSGLDSQKEIRIKYARNLPKVIAEKYNNDNKPTALLPQLNITRKRAETSASDDPAMGWTARLNFQVRDIVQERSLSQLKNKILNDNRVKEKNSRIDHSNFRTVYQEKNYLQKLEAKLDKEITPDKINLIKYLNQKENLSEVMINKIANFDDEKSNKLNKICQIVFHKQNDDTIFQNMIKKALTVHKNREKVEYRNKLETLGDNIKDLDSVLKKYPKQEFNREKYKDIHNDMLKTWKRNHSDRLQRTHWKFISTGTNDLTANVSKIINASDIN
jgi:hypothetical protein